MNAVENQMLDLMTGWDYDMSADKVPPTVFEFFSDCFAENLLGDELDELYDQLPGSIKDYYIYRILKEGPDEWVDDIRTPETETLDDIIFRSFRDAAGKLSDSYGDDVSKWNWGEIHKITLEHPIGSIKIMDRIFRLNSETYAAGGSDHTVCPYSYGKGFRVTNGASERHIYNLADWDESWTVIPTGASGVPASEFYLSQTKTYVEGGFYRDLFSEGAVKAAARYVLKLKPS
ncbi:MAG: penicillin acylase family protein [Bacteroidales bacterium]|nr:penicillin acylase family protein [Bacteroidales bacterium]